MGDTTVQKTCEEPQIEITTLDSIKARIVEGAQKYFEQSGEKLVDGFLPVIVDSLFDEYKVIRRFPDYFTQEQIDLDVMRYFNRKWGYIALKVIPMVYGKIGAEGLTSLTDNQVTRTWSTESHFPDVVPYCEVV